MAFFTRLGVIKYSSVFSTLSPNCLRLKHTLPDLPYDYNALEPVISADIMRTHHTKHHAAYVNNLNIAEEKYQEAKSKNDVQTMISLTPQLIFNGGGHINHSIFWQNLAPKNRGGGDLPSGALSNAITEQFGSLTQFVELFNRRTVSIQGSGWGWLGFNKEIKKLEIITCANQDPLSLRGLVPLLGIDVWEHAYYLQYKAARIEYLTNIWQIVNWKDVADRYTSAIKAA